MDWQEWVLLMLNEASLDMKSKFSKASQSFPRLGANKMLVRSHGLPGVDHTGSLLVHSAFSHCHKSFGHRCPQLCFRRRIYRICDPSAIRSRIWRDPCDPICRPLPGHRGQLWGGVNSRAQLF